MDGGGIWHLVGFTSKKYQNIFVKYAVVPQSVIVGGEARDGALVDVLCDGKPSQAKIFRTDAEKHHLDLLEVTSHGNVILKPKTVQKRVHPEESDQEELKAAAVVKRKVELEISHINKMQSILKTCIQTSVLPAKPKKNSSTPHVSGKSLLHSHTSKSIVPSRPQHACVDGSESNITHISDKSFDSQTSPEVTSQMEVEMVKESIAKEQGRESMRSNNAAKTSTQTPVLHGKPKKHSPISNESRKRVLQTSRHASKSVMPSHTQHASVDGSKSNNSHGSDKLLDGPTSPEVLSEMEVESVEESIEEEQGRECMRSKGVAMFVTPTERHFILNVLRNPKAPLVTAAEIAALEGMLTFYRNLFLVQRSIHKAHSEGELFSTSLCEPEEEICNSGPGVGKVELRPGSGVYILAAKKDEFTSDCQNKPLELMRKLTKLLVGERRLAAMSALGSGRYRAIPSKIYNTIKEYIFEDVLKNENLISDPVYTQAANVMCGSIRHKYGLSKPDPARRGRRRRKNENVSNSSQNIKEPDTTSSELTQEGLCEVLLEEGSRTRSSTPLMSSPAYTVND